MLGRIAIATLLAGCQVVFPRDDATGDAAMPDDGRVDAPTAMICTMQDFSGSVNAAVLEPYMDPGVTTDLAEKTFNVHLIDNPTNQSYGGLTFVPGPLDFTGGTFSMKIVRLPTPSFNEEVELKLAQDADVYRAQVSNNRLRMEYVVGGMRHQLLDRAYDLATEPVLRVRHDVANNIIVFESGDGVVFPTHFEAPVAIPLAGLKLGINIGTSASVPNPGTGSVDEVLISALACPSP